MVGGVTGSLTRTSYGDVVYSKVRRFVVVKEGKETCLAIPISNYRGCGIAKPGVKKSDHGIVFTGRTPLPPAETEKPDPLTGEQGMQPHAIRVDPDVAGAKLDAMARINFGAPRTVHHYVKVKAFGVVNHKSLLFLKSQFQSTVLAAPQLTLGGEANVPHPSSSLISEAFYNRAYASLMKDSWTAEDALAFLRPIKVIVNKSSGP